MSKLFNHNETRNLVEYYGIPKNPTKTKIEANFKTEGKQSCHRGCELKVLPVPIILKVTLLIESITSTKTLQLSSWM